MPLNDDNNALNGTTTSDDVDENGIPLANTDNRCESAIVRRRNILLLLDNNRHVVVRFIMMDALL